MTIIQLPPEPPGSLKEYLERAKAEKRKAQNREKSNQHYRKKKATGMKEIKNIYIESHAIRRHKVEKFRKLKDAGKIFDFLPLILNHEIPIMTKWEKYFRGLKIPFVITEETRKLGEDETQSFWILWKKKVAG